MNTDPPPWPQESKPSRRRSGAARRKDARIRRGDPPGNDDRLSRMLSQWQQFKRKVGPFWIKWEAGMIAAAARAFEAGERVRCEALLKAAGHVLISRSRFLIRRCKRRAE